MLYIYSIITVLLIKGCFYFFKKNIFQKKYQYLIDLLLSILLVVIFLSHPINILFGIWVHNYYFWATILSALVIVLLFIRSKIIYGNTGLIFIIKSTIIQILIITLSVFIWSMLNTLLNSCGACLPATFSNISDSK